MNVLGIVTARGGSRGIPQKNLTLLSGRPLLAYTADAALRAKNLTKIVISTDDEEISRAAQAMGLECPFMRPPELARDETPTIPVLQDVVQRLEEAGETYDAIFTLQPTNPLRIAADIDGAIALLEVTGADSVVGYSHVGERHPARMKSIDPSGRVMDPPFAEQFEGQRRQDLPVFWLRDGSVYLTRRDVLMQQNSIKGSDCRGWVIPTQRAINIDEPFDLYLAEQLLKLDPEQYPGRPAAQPVTTDL